ncbi:hypothetical protein GE278_24300 (plasmid) [Enterobacteriaceae bacterium Kacie_13]|nr:hypothetical protein GE278_24300 [Enterobacteriaceae bacterium Kacie_13]
MLSNQLTFEATMTHSTEKQGYTSITQAQNWFLRVQNESGQIAIYPVAVWVADGFKVKGLVSMYKGMEPCLFTAPPACTSQYVHGDQLTEEEKRSVTRVYNF